MSIAPGRSWSCIACTGVGAQIEQNLLDLRRVGQHRGRIRRRNPRSGSRPRAAWRAAGAPTPPPPARAMSPCARASGAGRRRGSAAPGPSRGGSPCRFPPGSPAPRVRAHVLARQLDVAHDRGQDIVEVVRHAAGQRAQRLHLLRLAQLRFERGAFGLGLLALGDVAGNAHRGVNRPRRRASAPVLFQPPPRAFEPTTSYSSMSLAPRITRASRRERWRGTPGAESPGGCALHLRQDSASSMA